VNNLEYGSYAPGAPSVFLTDAAFVERWRSEQRCYLVVALPRIEAIEALVGKDALHLVTENGGKFLYTNHPLGRRANAAEPRQ
jgi:hypothetical protein